MTFQPPEEPRVLARPEHRISRKKIDQNALKVLYRLHNAGHKGYLVGGSVRDLMLGIQPKDFDISTDARPPQIRRLFRNSRIIGRRFRLAHIYFREGIIEVATFRRDPDPEAQDSAPGDLLITDDNVFGSPREDAFRRDFTVNAVFYSIGDFSVIDYVGGVEDLERRLIRAIGDPDVRFQEDPVRMTRACELAARLDFSIEKDTRAAMTRQARELEKASPARLTDELLELLRCGHAGRGVQWMLDLGLAKVLIPEARAVEEARQRDLEELGRVLPVLDSMVMADREVSDTALLAALLLPEVLLRRLDAEAERGRRLRRNQLELLIADAVQPFFLRLNISKVRADRVAQAISDFQRLGQPQWRDGARLAFAQRGSFDDALLLLEIMVDAAGEGKEALERWQAVRRQRERQEPKRRRGGRRPRRRQRRRRRGKRHGGQG